MNLYAYMMNLVSLFTVHLLKKLLTDYLKFSLIKCSYLLKSFFVIHRFYFILGSFRQDNCG